MIMMSGILKNLVKQPISNMLPHKISNVPTNGPKKSGLGIPILVNLPTPSWAGNRNF
jgi:hypothetical protein